MLPRLLLIAYRIALLAAVRSQKVCMPATCLSRVMKRGGWNMPLTSAHMRAIILSVQVPTSLLLAIICAVRVGVVPIVVMRLVSCLQMLWVSPVFICVCSFIMLLSRPKFCMILAMTRTLLASTCWSLGIMMLLWRLACLMV